MLSFRPHTSPPNPTHPCSSFERDLKSPGLGGVIRSHAQDLHHDGREVCQDLIFRGQPFTWRLQPQKIMAMPVPAGEDSVSIPASMPFAV